MRLQTLSDFAGRRGFDFTFMQCTACRAFLMDVYWAGSNTTNVIDARYYPAMARQLKTMYDTLTSCVESLGLPDV